MNLKSLPSIVYEYNSEKLSFQRKLNGFNTVDEALVALNLTSDDLYWVMQTDISLSKATEFLMTASTWVRRFGNQLRVKAEEELALEIKLNDVSPEHLLFTLKWLVDPALIKELYTPMGFVTIKGELWQGVAPEYFSSDLHESGAKEFTGERLQTFLKKEWSLLQGFMVPTSETQESLLTTTTSIVLQNPQNEPDFNPYLRVDGKELLLSDLPEVFNRYGFIETKIGYLRGEQLFKAGLRPFKRFFTGTPLNECQVELEDLTLERENLTRITRPDSWFYNAGFISSDSASDILLAGEADFTYLARQTKPGLSNKLDIVKVIRAIKEATQNHDSEDSLQKYISWRDQFLQTGETNNEPLCALIFLLELINGLYDGSRDDKYMMFWPLWQCVGRYGNREVKGRFIEGALDWSLIQGYLGIYGYMSTLKNGYLHNALLWPAFLPENRDSLDPEMCAELAGIDLKKGVFHENQEFRELVSLVFGKLDDFYREITGTSFLANFHPDSFGKKEYVPFKDQIYAGYIEKIKLAELAPLVKHRPLQDFSREVFKVISDLLEGKKTTANNYSLPPEIVTLISDIVQGM